MSSEMTALVAAAVQTNPGNINLEAMRLWSIARGVQRYVDFLESDETVVFVKRLDAVEIVKTQAHDGTELAGKCRLILEPDEGEDEAETIETDWLNQQWPWMIYQIAALNVGDRVAVFKHNTEPTPDAPQGYRRCVWVGGRHFPPDVPPVPQPGQGPPSAPAAPTVGEDKADQLADSTRTDELMRLSGCLEPSMLERLREYRIAEYGEQDWPWPSETIEACITMAKTLMEEPF